MEDRLLWRVKHTNEEHQCRQHHARSTLPSLAMHDNSRLVLELVLLAYRVAIRSPNLVMLLHPLKKERSIKAKLHNALD